MERRLDLSILTPAFSRSALASYIPTISESQLRDWKRDGTLEPSVVNFSSQGFKSYWSVRDVVVLEFSARLEGVHFASFPKTIRAVDAALPPRLDNLPFETELYWNGGELHVFNSPSAATVALDEPTYVGDLFSVRGSVRDRYDHALAAARPVDVMALVRSPEMARGRRAKPE